MHVPISLPAPPKVLLLHGVQKWLWDHTVLSLNSDFTTYKLCHKGKMEISRDHILPALPRPFWATVRMGEI